jgi:hypothetical protein
MTIVRWFSAFSQFLICLRCLLFPALAVSAFVFLMTGKLNSADPPHAEISNGLVRAQIFLPDQVHGYYRGTRFDWSGTIASLEFKGHRFFGPWFVRVDPSVRDIQYDPAVDGFIAGTASANLGPVEEFSAAIGYEEAALGGTFLKVGVGILRKPDEQKYAFANHYEIVNGGKWSYRKAADRVVFTHELADSSGYGYIYTKTVSLTKDKAELVLEHSLRNTGRKLIETPVYDHNFIVLDGKTIGPDFTIKLPFEIKEVRDKQGFAETRGKEIVYLKELQKDERAMVPITGFGEDAGSYDIRVENRSLGAGLRIRGDRPLTRMMVWAIHPTCAPEPFIGLKAEPGAEFKWRLTYEFYTLP